MRIVVPYVPGMLQLGTEAALLGWCTNYVDVSASDTAYHDLLTRLWAAPDDILIVEQDMAPTDDLISEVEHCDAEWCAAPYWTASGKRFETAFGFVRFSASLMERCPGVPHLAGAFAELAAPARHWRRVDVRWSQALRAVGAVPHIHDSPLPHLNPTYR